MSRAPETPQGSRDLSGGREPARLGGEQFESLLEAAPDAMVIVDERGDIVLVNSQTERLFGYSRIEVLGRPVEMLMPASFRAAHQAHRQRYFDEPRVREMGEGATLHGRRKDGSEFPVEISLSPLETTEGRLVTAAIRDVTERRRFERALSEKNLELEAANRTKDRFLATMSHELRTPLNAIIGFTGTLLMRLPGPLTTEQEEQLRTVQRSGQHLLALINDLLDLAKIESGKVHLVVEAVHCQKLLDELAASLAPAARAKGLTFVVEAPAEPLWLRTDRRALNQILLNLLSNAIKFTERGRVRVFAERAPDGGAGVRFGVSDSGVGIRAEDRERLFQAFEQLESTAERRHEGSGLGLNLSQKLAALLHSRLSVESEWGEGTTFFLTLTDLP